MINAIKIDGELMSLPNFNEFEDIDAKTKLNYELLEFMFSAYSRYGLLETKDLVEFVEKNNLKSLLVKQRKEQPSQQEFDNKVADIVALGLNFSEVHEHFRKLFSSYTEREKNYLFTSKILSAYLKANDKEITKYIVNS